VSQVDRLFDILIEHEEKFNRSISLIPSENAISPAARIAFLSDAFARYFFDERKVFGRWSFEGGSIAGRIQTEIVTPLLCKIGNAEYVSVHAISGLTAMTTALAAFGGDAGNHIISVDPSNGGHADTGYVAQKLGYVVHSVPFAGWAAVDFDALAELVSQVSPSLIYIDHATALVPIDIQQLVSTVRAASGSNRVHIHVDTSHVNGLVWGGQLRNPLVCGADSYGGSTHKTFPGPHKAVIFTNDGEIAEKLTLTAINMISHHHLSSVIALGIALIEFTECGGERYAAQVLANARTFARALAKHGIAVEGTAPWYTATHQVWVTAAADVDPYKLASQLFQAGIVVNPYNPLPTSRAAGIRMGVNEPTRLGAQEAEMDELATAFADVTEGEPIEAVGERVAGLRSRLSPQFCLDDQQVSALLRRLDPVFADARRFFVRATP
jgi:glycine hydroxymethyltransferase